MEIDARGFRGTGLDKDSDIDFIVGGDSRNRHNCGFIFGDYDSVLPRKVPTQITHALPTGTNTIVGSIEDKENKAAIILIHNSNDEHSIVRIYSNGTTENIIYGESALEFDLDYPIHSIDLIGDGDDLELSWTDGNTRPKAIVIKDFIDGVHTPIDYSVINRARPAPIYKPSLSIGTNLAYTDNNINGKLFQFAYRYVYRNKQRSALSHWSEVNYNDHLDYPNARLDENQFISNYIELTMYSNLSSVDKVEIFYRVVDDEFAPGFWYYYDEAEASIPSFTYDFYNDKPGYAITDEEANLLYDDVPESANAQEAISKNRIVYGGITKGKDDLDPNNSLEFDVELSPTYKAPVTGVTGSDSAAHTELDTATIANSANSNIDISGAIGGETTSYWIYVAYNDGTQDVFSMNDSSTLDIVDYLVAEINAGATKSITASDGGVNLVNIANATGANITVTAYAFYTSDKYITLKDGESYPLAIRYYDSFDKNGNTLIIPISSALSPGGSVYIPRDSTSQFLALPDTSGEGCLVKGVRYTIKHYAPDWAVAWQFMAAKSNIQECFTIPIFFDDFEQETKDVGVSGGKTTVDLQQAVDRHVAQLGVVPPGYFAPEKGDYLRVRGGYDNTTGLNDELYGWKFRVSDVDENLIVYLDSFNRVSNSSIQIVEVIRYNNNTDLDDLVYYEIGDVLGIYTHGGQNCHRTSGNSDMRDAYTGSFGGVQDQTSLIDGTGTILWGDFYQMMMVPYASATSVMHGWMRSTSASYFYDSEFNSVGRYGFVSDDSEKKYYNSLVYSGTFSNDSLSYNELNKFNSSLIPIDDVYGRITALVEMGYSLYVFQRSKLTPIEIGRQTVEQDGQTMVVSTNVVFGSQRPFEEDFGTIYPGSITKWGNNLYWYDPLTVAFYKLSQSGMQDISMARMKSFFKELSDTITTGGYDNYEFKSFYDTVTESYVLIFQDKNTKSNSWSLSFHVPSGRWSGTENYKTEGAESVSGNKVFSFEGGVYSHHEASADYDDAYIDVHFNPSPLQHKLFHSIEVESNELWSTSDNPSIWVDDQDTAYQDPDNRMWYNGKHQSLIPNGNYKRINGKYKASFLRSILKKDGTSASTRYLYQGERLSGKTLTIRLKNATSSAINRLKYVAVSYTKR